MRNLLIVCFTLFLIHIARSEETPFTYQGRLADGGMPANGVYDLTFGLYSTNVGGVPLSVSITNTLSVTNGLFSTTLDFGSVFDGSAYWLELGVRTNGCGDFTILSPRSKVHPVPYAQHAESAANFTGMVSDNQISNSVPRLNKPVNNFSGTVTAATFIGSGSQVTNIPASSITGSPWLRNSSNLGDVSSKYAAAGNVGILDMNFQTAHQGYEAKNLATASFAGQFGVSYYDQGNFYFWRARSTIKGDWFKCWGTSAGGNFVAGDPFSMSPSSAYMNYFWSMGNPSLQVYGPYNSVDAQNVAVNCNPYISGSGWLCALVTTNAAHGWSCITTNANGERIFKSDTFTSYLAVPEQAPEFNLPGFGVIVQNGNDPFALCSAYNLNGITGNYSYFQTAPYAHQLLFPVWRTNAWRSTSNNFAATKLDTYTGSWNFISNINVNGTIISGTNTTPTPSAALEVNSTTKGFLLPRMTKAQRDTITSPVAGLSVYQTDNIPGLRVYNGTKWVRYSEIED